MGKNEFRRYEREARENTSIVKINLLTLPSCNHCQRIFAKYCRFQPDIFSLDNVQILARNPRFWGSQRTPNILRRFLVDFLQFCFWNFSPTGQYFELNSARQIEIQAKLTTRNSPERTFPLTIYWLKRMFSLLVKESN